MNSAPNRIATFKEIETIRCAKCASRLGDKCRIMAGRGITTKTKLVPHPERAIAYFDITEVRGVNSAEGTERVMEPTKGPWHYQEESDAYTHIIRGPNNEFIGSAPQGSKGHDEANARLMATAPQLLEALKDQRQLMVGYRSRLECDGAYVAAIQVDDRIEAVSAIIAKAEAKS